MILVNVEADCMLGPELRRRADTAGVVYSMAYGDHFATLWPPAPTIAAAFPAVHSAG